MAVAVTIFAGLTYATAQQSLRFKANDPQIQMAEDNALAFAGGQLPQSLLLSPRVDIEKSLAPNLILFDE
jgi:hypothetical protein